MRFYSVRVIVKVQYVRVLLRYCKESYQFLCNTSCYKKAAAKFPRSPFPSGSMSLLSILNSTSSRRHLRPL